jgi:hypothetical protein
MGRRDAAKIKVLVIDATKTQGRSRTATTTSSLSWSANIQSAPGVWSSTDTSANRSSFDVSQIESCTSESVYAQVSNRSVIQLWPSMRIQKCVIGEKRVKSKVLTDLVSRKIADSALPETFPQTAGFPQSELMHRLQRKRERLRPEESILIASVQDKHPRTQRCKGHNKPLPFCAQRLASAAGRSSVCRLVLRPCRLLDSALRTGASLSCLHYRSSASPNDLESSSFVILVRRTANSIGT